MWQRTSTIVSVNMLICIYIMFCLCILLYFADLKENRKLALVLDIDHTLLHCIMGADKHNRLITPEKFDTEDDNMFVLNQKTGSFETAPYVHKAMEAHCHTILLSDGSNRPPSPYTVKIRPYLTWMLNELTRLYQITLYTNGTRAYAEAVAAVIDPDNSYFNKRIVARTDMNRRVMPIGRGEQDSITDFSNYHAPTLISSNSSKSLGSSSTIDDGLYDGNKSLKLLYLNATSLVVIVDDKADVWGEDSKVSVKTNASAADNLLLIKPYIFFKGDVHEIYNRDDNRNNKAAQNTNAVSASVTAHVEQLKENDDILVRYCSLLKNIHSQVYSLNETVPSVIKILKSSVLKGCCISFSGLIPRKGSDNSYFIGHPLYKLACSLGAKVIDDFVVDGSNAVSEKITHLVCNKDTDKLGTSKYFYCVRNYKCNGVNSLNSGSNNEFVENRNCVHLVSVEWLTACRHFCEHVSESAFHVPLLKLLSGNGNKNESVSNIVESNIKKRKLEELVVISGADDSDSDDFNEWANEL